MDAKRRMNWVAHETIRSASAPTDLHLREFASAPTDLHLRELASAPTDLHLREFATAPTDLRIVSGADEIVHI